MLARHGETVWHAENRYAGRSDVALNPRGLEQAEALAHWAAGAELSAIWTSPLSRARRTAEPAARAAGLPLQEDARLLELDFGRGEGLTDAEMHTAFPAERAAFLLDPAANFLPGGEVPEAAAERALAAARSIAQAQVEAKARSLIVAHSTLLRLLLCRLLGIPLSRYRTALPALRNGAVTELDMTPQGAGLLSFNVPLPRSPHTT